MKPYNTIWKRMLAAISAGCLCFSLAACGQPAAEPNQIDESSKSDELNDFNQSNNPNGTVSEPSSTTDGGGNVFPITYYYKDALKSGRLVCTVNGVHVVDSTGGLPDTGGFKSDATCYFQDGGKFRYPDFIQDDGQLIPGLYLLLTELTVTSEDAVAFTRRDNNFPIIKGEYDDPYVFRADDLITLVDIFTNSAGNTQGIDVYLCYYSGLDQRAEHPMAYRLEPGESMDLTVGFLVSDILQGGGWDLDNLYLSTAITSDPDDTLIHLDLSSEEVMWP